VERRWPLRFQAPSPGRLTTSPYGATLLLPWHLLMRVPEPLLMAISLPTGAIRADPIIEAIVHLVIPSEPGLAQSFKIRTTVDAVGTVALVFMLSPASARTHLDIGRYDPRRDSAAAAQVRDRTARPRADP